MGKFSQNTERYSGKKKPQAGVTAALVLLVVVLAAVLAGLLLRGSFPAGEAAADTPAIPSVPPETAVMQVPEKVPFQPTANGNSTSVLRRASYTAAMRRRTRWLHGRAMPPSPSGSCNCFI